MAFLVDKWSIKFNLVMCLLELVDQIDASPNPENGHQGIQQACYFLQRAAAVADEILLQTKQIQLLNQSFWVNLETMCGDDLNQKVLQATRDSCLARAQRLQYAVVSKAPEAPAPGSEMSYVLSGIASKIHKMYSDIHKNCIADSILKTYARDEVKLDNTIFFQIVLYKFLSQYHFAHYLHQ